MILKLYLLYFITPSLLLLGLALQIAPHSVQPQQSLYGASMLMQLTDLSGLILPKATEQ